MRYTKSKDISTEKKTDSDRIYSKYNEELGITIQTKHYLSEDKDQNWPTINNCKYPLTELKITWMFLANWIDIK